MCWEVIVVRRPLGEGAVGAWKLAIVGVRRQVLAAWQRPPELTAGPLRDHGKDLTARLAFYPQEHCQAGPRVTTVSVLSSGWL